jgi:hypothetical protein
MKFHELDDLTEVNNDPKTIWASVVCPIFMKLLPLNLPLSGLYWQFLAGDCIYLPFEKLSGNMNKPFIHREMLDSKVVGWVGLEPTTNALKGHCSTD